jgi:hypothetical protein
MTDSSTGSVGFAGSLCVPPPPPPTRPVHPPPLRPWSVQSKRTSAITVIAPMLPRTHLPRNFALKLKWFLVPWALARYGVCLVGTVAA